MKNIIIMVVFVVGMFTSFVFFSQQHIARVLNTEEEKSIIGGAVEYWMYCKASGVTSCAVSYPPAPVLGECFTLGELCPTHNYCPGLPLDSNCAKASYPWYSCNVGATADCTSSTMACTAPTGGNAQMWCFTNMPGMGPPGNCGTHNTCQ